MAERLTRQKQILEASLARRVVFLDKELYSTLSFFTQVYNMGTGDILPRGRPAMD